MTEVSNSSIGSPAGERRQTARPYWPPLPAGFALGIVVLLTFLLTSHGLNVSGFIARLSAWSANLFAPAATQWNEFLGPQLAGWFPAQDWVTWEIGGILCGGLVGSLAARRFRIQLDSPRPSGVASRIALAFVGGALAGFGARLARGCTASVGLSGAAALATAGFLFLAGFFAAGLVTGWLLRRRRP